MDGLNFKDLTDRYSLPTVRLGKSKKGFMDRIEVLRNKGIDEKE